MGRLLRRLLGRPGRHSDAEPARHRSGTPVGTWGTASPPGRISAPPPPPLIPPYRVDALLPSRPAPPPPPAVPAPLAEPLPTTREGDDAEPPETSPGSPRSGSNRIRLMMADGTVAEPDEDSELAERIAYLAGNIFADRPRRDSEEG